MRKMDIKKVVGTTRVVFIFKKIVIKLPRISFRRIGLVIASNVSSSLVFVKRDGFRKYFFSLLKNRKELKRSFKKNAYQKSITLGLKMLPHKKYEFIALNHALFAGIMANWHEFLFYLKTRNSFLLPTYFSFLGLINIQKRGQKLEWDDSKSIFSFFVDNSKKRDQVFCDAHSFENSDNFCWDEGKLKMLDYGSRHCRSFIISNWENLQNNFPKPSKE